MVCVEATVGSPFHKTRMSSVSKPGVSRQRLAAISPVVYICAIPGDSSKFAAVNLLPQQFCASSSQSCSPVVSV
jgi:hypothetical protein